MEGGKEGETLAGLQGKRGAHAYFSLFVRISFTLFLFFIFFVRFVSREPKEMGGTWLFGVTREGERKGSERVQRHENKGKKGELSAAKKDIRAKRAKRHPHRKSNRPYSHLD